MHILFLEESQRTGKGYMKGEEAEVGRGLYFIVYPFHLLMFYLFKSTVFDSFKRKDQCHILLWIPAHEVSL